MTAQKRLPAALLVALGSFAAAASMVGATEFEQPAAATPGKDLTPEQRKQAREAELEAIRRTIAVSERRQTALKQEIEGLRKDRAALSADLIATGRRLRSTEDEISQIEARLDQLHARQDQARDSLRKRRDVLADVLMALQ